MTFLFCLFLVGLIVASIIDLKTKIVPNWLTLTLLFSGLAYIIITNLSTPSLFLQLSWFILFMAAIAILFYQARFFAGGDAQLLFSMTPIFLAPIFTKTFLNLATFIFSLFIAGAIYGLAYTLILFFLNYNKTKKDFKKIISQNQMKLSLIAGVILSILSIFFTLLILPGIILIILPPLFATAKSIEKNVLTKTVSPEKLEEGDWLVKDIKIKSKTIQSSWDGLSSDDISLLRKLKIKAKIKYGIPYVPAFLIAFLIWSFWLINFF